MERGEELKEDEGWKEGRNGKAGRAGRKGKCTVEVWRGVDKTEVRRQEEGYKKGEWWK